MTPIRSQDGFTLVELVAAMAILTIALSIAAFSFKDVLWRSQVNVAAAELVTALNYARNEAVSRATSVAICRLGAEAPPPDPLECGTDPGGWQAGYMVFIDADENGELETAEDLLRVFPAQRGGMTMEGLDLARFRPNGFLAAGAGTLEVTNPSSTRTINVQVFASGRVSTQTP